MRTVRRSSGARAIGRLVGLGAALWSAAWAGLAVAQHHGQVAIGAPLAGVGNGFFEQTGVNFNAHGPGWFLQQNGFGAAAPGFGGAVPGGVAGTGFGFQFPGGGASFNIAAGQGAATGISGVAPSVTAMNGQNGSMFVGTVSPFVLSVVPIVGAAPVAPWAGSPLGERVSRLQEGGASTSGVRAGPPAAQAREAADSQRAALATDDPRSPDRREAVGARQAGPPRDVQPAALQSVAEIKAQRAAAERETQREAESLAARAREAEAAGKFGVARIYFQQAARRATGALKEECEARLATLANTASATGARGTTTRPTGARATADSPVGANAGPSDAPSTSPPAK